MSGNTKTYLVRERQYHLYNTCIHSGKSRLPLFWSRLAFLLVRKHPIPFTPSSRSYLLSNFIPNFVFQKALQTLSEIQTGSLTRKMGFSKPSYFTCLTTWWYEQQSDLSDLPICSRNGFVLTTQKSAEHSLVLKIDIHCACWWEHSEFVCSFSTRSYQIIFEGARRENHEASKVVLHAETKKNNAQNLI